MHTPISSPGKKHAGRKWRIFRRCLKTDLSIIVDRVNYLCSIMFSDLPLSASVGNHEIFPRKMSPSEFIQYVAFNIYFRGKIRKFVYKFRVQAAHFFFWSATFNVFFNTDGVLMVQVFKNLSSTSEIWLAKFSIRYAAPHATLPKGSSRAIAHRCAHGRMIGATSCTQRNTQLRHYVTSVMRQKETANERAVKRGGQRRKEDGRRVERNGNNEFARRDRDLPRRVIKRVLPAGNDCCLARANSTRERNEGLCGSRVCYWLA